MAGQRVRANALNSEPAETMRDRTRRSAPQAIRVPTRAARLVLLVLIAVAVLSAGCERGNDTTAEVVIDGERFELEIAADQQSRELGLGGRESIPEHGGMLFVFAQPMFLQFHMKDCLVDIDILFLDGGGRITAMHRMTAEPPRREDETEAEYLSRLTKYGSGRPAMFAIELRAGWLDQLDLEPQDKVEMDLQRLKDLGQSSDAQR